MEVKIGVADSPRELVLVSDQTHDEVEKLVTDALSGNGSGVLALIDEKGRNSVMWPTFTWHYRARTKQFDLENYTQRTAAAGATA